MGETYGLYYENSSVVLNLVNNMYFQYKANFLTSNVSFTPQLNYTEVFYSDDITPPTINLTNYINATTRNDNSTLTLNISLSDSELGLINSVCIISINGTNQSISVNNGWCNISNINLTGLPDGNHTIKVYANDSVNNVGTNNSFVVFMDSTKPTVTFSCDSELITQGETLICTCSGVDPNNGSGINIISHTQNPSTTSIGTFSTSCTVTDKAKNSANKSLSYIVDAPLPTGGSPSTPSTGSPTLTQTSLLVNVEPWVETTISSFENTGIKEISIIINQQVQNIRIKVLKYDSKPTEVSIGISGKIYRYLEIRTENLNENLEKAIVKFEVEKSWLEINNLETSDVSVFKFDNNTQNWNELETTFENEDNGNYIYSVELDSFSFFAVAEKIKIPIISDIVDIITDSYEASSKNKVSLFLWWNILFMILVGIVIVVVLILQERNRII